VRKKIALFAMMLMASLPSPALTKITVEQLNQLLAEQHKLAKSDDATAAKLQDVSLSEQLTTDKMDSFTQYEPGPLTVTQIRVLAADSAMLPPPPSYIPTIAAPDAAAQAALLAKAINYDVHTYAGLPAMSAEKTTTRYQNGVDYVQTNSGAGSNFANGSLELRPVNPYFRLLRQHSTPVAFERGVELPPAKTKAIDPASPYGQSSQGGAGMILGAVLIDAAKGKITWLRWQLVDGKKTAVFAFTVDKKQSSYTVNYCCFPVRENTGGHTYGANQGTSVSFKSFTAKPAYHGEIFIDAETGVIVRLITKAELKPTDLVHQEDTRVDYGPVEIAGKTFIVPKRSVILTEVVPNGDSYIKYSVRRTLFDVNYLNYQLR
jgi:hypothetical protein